MIVPDTNILVSGSIIPYGNPAFILDSWRNGKFDVIKEDPDDNKFLEVAVEGKADYIVSWEQKLSRQQKW